MVFHLKYGVSSLGLGRLIQREINSHFELLHGLDLEGKQM